MLRRTMIYWMTLFLCIVTLSGCTIPEQMIETPQQEQDEQTQQVIRLADGMTDEARQIYFHHTEMDPESGTGLFPWPWVQALHDLETGQPFMQNFERFGLIRDHL